MKYAVEMGSGAMIYIQNSIKVDSGIHESMGRGNSQTDSQTTAWRSHKPTFTLQSKENKLKTFKTQLNFFEMKTGNSIKFYHYHLTYVAVDAGL
jgi:hypothetical protein